MSYAHVVLDSDVLLVRDAGLKFHRPGDEDGDVNMKGAAPGGGAMAGERLGGGAGGPRGKSQVVGSMIAVSEGSSEEKSDDGSSDAISVGKSE